MPPFFSSFVFPGFQPGNTKLEKKGGRGVAALTQGGGSAYAPLRRTLPWAISLLPLRGAGRLRHFSASMPEVDSRKPARKLIDRSAELP
jgi:hypothetical protein